MPRTKITRKIGGVFDVAKYQSTEKGHASVVRYRAKAIARGRSLIDRIKKERGCVDCGFNKHPAALHFDHLPGQGKWYNIADMLYRSPEAILAEIKKCEVVCANCHAIRTAHRRSKVAV
jgi:hypothetical protein